MTKRKFHCEEDENKLYPNEIGFAFNSMEDLGNCGIRVIFELDGWHDSIVKYNKKSFIVEKCIDGYLRRYLSSDDRPTPSLSLGTDPESRRIQARHEGYKREDEESNLHLDESNPSDT